MNEPRFCLLRLEPYQNVIGLRCRPLPDADICREEDAFFSNARLVAWRVNVLNRFADATQFLYAETAFFLYFSHKRFFGRFTALRAAAWKEAAMGRLHDGNVALGVKKKRIRAWARNVSLTWNTRTELRDFHLVACKLS